MAVAVCLAAKINDALRQASAMVSILLFSPIALCASALLQADVSQRVLI